MQCNRPLAELIAHRGSRGSPPCGLNENPPVTCNRAAEDVSAADRVSASVLFCTRCVFLLGNVQCARTALLSPGPPDLLLRSALIKALTERLARKPRSSASPTSRWMTRHDAYLLVRPAPRCLPQLEDRVIQRGGCMAVSAGDPIHRSSCDASARCPRCNYLSHTLALLTSMVVYYACPACGCRWQQPRIAA